MWLFCLHKLKIYLHLIFFIVNLQYNLIKMIVPLTEKAAMRVIQLSIIRDAIVQEEQFKFFNYHEPTRKNILEN